MEVPEPSAGFAGGRTLTRAGRILPLLVIALLCLPGFVQLDADQHLHWTDLGYWAADARNDVLFGEPFQDNYNLSVLSPLHHLLVEAAFRLLSPGIAVARLLGGIKALGLILIVFLLARRHYGRRVALLAVVLLGTNQFFISMTRLALPEPLNAILLLIGIHLYFDPSGRRWTPAAAGVFAGLSAWGKISGATGLAPFVLLVLHDAVRGESRRRGAGALAGIACGAMAGAIYPVLHWQRFLFMLSLESARGAGSGYFSSLGRFLHWSEHPLASPTLLGLLFWSVLAALVGRWGWSGGPGRFLAGERLTRFLVFSILLKTALNPLVSGHHPARRWEELFPMAAILAAAGIDRILSAVSGSAAGRGPASCGRSAAMGALMVSGLAPLWWRVSVVTGWPFPAVVAGALFLLCVPMMAARRVVTVNSVPVVLLVAGVGYLLLHVDRPRNVPAGAVVTLSLLLAAAVVDAVGRPRVPGTGRAILFAAGISLFIPLIPYVTGRGFTHGGIEFARRAAARIGTGEHVIGDQAFTFCLENQGIPVQYAFARPDHLNANRSPFDDFAPRWAIAGPDEVVHARVFASVPVDSWAGNTFLLRLDERDVAAARSYREGALQRRAP